MSTYTDLLAQKEALDARIQAAFAAEIEGVIAGVRQIIADYGLTAQECGFVAVPTATVTSIKQVTPRAPVAVKYRGPNGETWTGRGRAPAWISVVESRGGTREEFAIEKDAA